MLNKSDIAFLLDVDNTLLDTDRFGADLGVRLEQAFGADKRDRYWAIFAALREEQSYADYLAALEKFRVGLDDDPELLQISSFLLEYPFVDRPVFDATNGVDGWVSMEVSPLLADDTSASIDAATRIYGQAERPNLYVKIPGTPEGIPAIEESIYNGVPINVTLLFLREQYVAARWRTLAAAGARPQRLLWASTGTKDPHASDTLYVEALAAPDTIDTIPERTLRAFAEHGAIKGVMPEDGGDAENVLARFARAGIDPDALGMRLQRKGAQAFVKSWQELMTRIADKSDALAHAG